MLEIFESRTLFGDTSLHYFDPIAGKPIFKNCETSNSGVTRDIIKREVLFNLCFHFLKNRQNAATWLENNHGHAAAKDFSAKVAKLAGDVNQLPGISDLSLMADYVHLHIYPAIMMMTPKAKNLQTDRYVRLTEHLDSLLTQIRWDDVCNVKSVKNGQKAENY